MERGAVLETSEAFESAGACVEACGDATGDTPEDDAGADGESGVDTDAGAATVGGGKGTITAQELAAAVAEAEQRGYLRGRNESIEALMEMPPEEDRVEILQHRRVSIWDL